MMALTLWQPWAWAISDHTKRIENRTWRPPPHREPELLAIHAGTTFDEEAAQGIEEDFGVRIPRPCVQKAVVAVARYGGVVTRSSDPWFVGPFGWVLEDVVKLDIPIGCRGAQGLWDLPGDVERAVMREVAKARKEQDVCSPMGTTKTTDTGTWRRSAMTAHWFANGENRSLCGLLKRSSTCQTLHEPRCQHCLRILRRDPHEQNIV
jgi:hypothetical protein